MGRLMTAMTNEEKRKFQIEKDMRQGDGFTYLILLEGESDDNVGENYRTFELIKGRQNAYDFIKELLKDQWSDSLRGEFRMDVSLSRIISEPPASMVNKDTPRITLSNMLSVYAFMKLMKEKNKIIDETSFDISDYYDEYLGEPEEED